MRSENRNRALAPAAGRTAEAKEATRYASGPRQYHQEVA